MKWDNINIGDILLNKTYNGDEELLVVTGKSLDTSRYGSCYITTEVIKSSVKWFGDRPEERILTTLSLLQGIEKIA